MKSIILVGIASTLASFLCINPLACEAQNAAFMPYDYDGDGKSDLAVYESAEGNWYILESEAWAILSVQFGWDEARPVPGDFDGDGKADLAVYQRTSGTWYILYSSTWTISSLQFGSGSARPVSGDFDGDDKSDIALYERDTGTWYILYSSTWTISVLQFGSSATRPVPGDFDGDNKSDFALYERDTGTWYILYSSTWTISVLQFGSGSARPVSGDFDGDGKSDFAVYERDTGAWYIINSSSWSLCIEIFGSASSTPVPGDFDGDDRADPAVYDRSSGTWYIKPSSGGADKAIQFGSSSMAALPGFNGGATEGLVYLAFGDSITYGTGSSSDGPATGYPALLEPVLEPAFGGHFASANAGNPGEITTDGLTRFASELSRNNPDIVLLMEGTNDEFFQIPFSQTEANLRAMIETAMGQGIGVVIATIPPVISNQYRDRSGQMALIQAFNPRIYAIASDYGIPVARVHESITAVPGWEQLLIDQPTANHPNDAGYAIVADAFFAAISEGINAGLFY